MEMRREVGIRGLVVYLGEKKENLFKEQLVGKSDTEKLNFVSRVFNCYSC